MGPYRSSARVNEGHKGAQLGVARDLAFPFAALWLASLVRVVSVVLRGAPLQVEGTLALLALIALPALLLERRGRVDSTSTSTGCSLVSLAERRTASMSHRRRTG